ncbi:LacI family transcriptional regulator [Rhodovastum atsumiense]|nr:substrate-binding domain-containing protein [Rhodovastum atsumiense]CAH2603904.1 LacI family transcriptional regulator [Rhodovastum atsumiense]
MPKTIDDIARATGFSVTTVRLVTNGQAGKYRISAATQKAILDYVGKHGYVLNHAARSLKVKRSDAIGLVIPEINNVFFARLMAGLERLCAAHQLVLLTASTREDAEAETRAIETLIGRGVDGLIVAPAARPTYERAFGKRLPPLVIIDRAYPKLPWPAVASDNFGGAVQVTRGMLARATEPVIFLCANPDLPSIAARRLGFLAACHDAGLGDGAGLIHQVRTDLTEGGRDLAARAITTLGRVPSAFLCSSLLILEGMLACLKQRTGAIPADLLIGTFDDHPMLDFLPNRVLSIRQDEAALAEHAFHLLQRRIAGEAMDAQPEILPVSLMIRNDPQAAVALPRPTLVVPDAG